MSEGNLTRTILTLAGGVGLGATVMYFFDPARGRRRRAMCLDQLTSAAGGARDAVGSKARDLRNRASGVLAEAKSALTTKPAAEKAADGGELAAA